MDVLTIDETGLGVAEFEAMRERSKDRVYRSRRVTIAPTTARHILDHHNERNRHPKVHRIAGYAEDLKTGQWKFNAQPIQLGWDGTLLDGQNRLKACVAADQPIDVVLVTGQDPEVVDTIDRGSARSIGDHLAMRGRTNPNVLAAALKIVWLYEQGYTLDRQDLFFTPHKADETLANHTGVWGSILCTAQPKAETLLPHSIAGGLHYLFGWHDQALADKFFDLVGSGDSLRPCPTRVLRDRLLVEAHHRKGGTRRVEIIALVIKAWNAFRVGKPVKTLKWTSQGANPEPFPTF